MKFQGIIKGLMLAGLLTLLGEKLGPGSPESRMDPGTGYHQRGCDIPAVPAWSTRAP